MSLVKSLTRPLIAPLLLPLTGLTQDIIDAIAALGEKWPLSGSLIGSKGTEITLTRASQKIYQDARGQWRAYTDDVPAFGVGLSLEGASTNKCTNFNFAPDAALTNITLGTNVNGSRVIPTELPSGFQPLVDAAVSNGYVVEADNTDVSTRAVIIAGSTGNTNAHSATVWVRVTSGTGGTFGGTGGTVDSVAFTNTDWQKIDLENFTPGSTGTALLFNIDAGTTIEFIGNQLEESQIVTSPIAVEGSSATRALDDAQVSTTGFPVNDCAYYIELPRGITDNGASQMIFTSYVDTNNFTRIFYVPSSGIRFQKRIAGSNNQFTLTYAGDGSPINLLAINDSTAGWSAELSNGQTGSDVNTGDLPLGSTIQLGATTFLVNPLFSEEASFKYLNTSNITLEAAKYA